MQNPSGANSCYAHASIQLTYLLASARAPYSPAIRCSARRLVLAPCAAYLVSGAFARLTRSIAIPYVAIRASPRSDRS